MKIGLVRHFKVKKAFPDKLFVSPDELTQWFDEYDASDVEVGQTDLGGIDWTTCYSSDMTRAIKTAETIFDGNIVQMKQLREIPHPNFKMILGGKLPFLLWAILVRVLWLYTNHKSHTESKADVEKRIKTVLDEIVQRDQDNVLIVSHAALMMNMEKELLHRGFKGPRLKTPDNGKLYIFEK